MPWNIRVDMPDNDPCYYDEKLGFVDDKWSAQQYRFHCAAVDRAMCLSTVYPEYKFSIVPFR